MIRPGKQTGYILMPVIVVITLVAAIALMMNTESALESNTAGSELDAQQARYVAEAGLNHALWLSQQQGCGPYGNLTDEPLGNDKYTSNLITDLGSTTAVTINVDQDSWIRSEEPTINKGTDLKLHTRNETLGTERPLLRYDLSPIAAKAQILSATAWFYVTNAHAAGPIDIHLTSADWTETDATWDSMSTNMDSAVLATIPSQPVNNVWISVNLTSQVQAWVNGQPNFGITLNSPVDGVHGQYNSRESALPPYLEVIVGTPPSSPAVLKAVGTLANGVTRNITRNDATLVQHPASFVQWQHDATQGVDAYIWEANPTTNNGIDDETWVSRSTNNTSLSLFKFDVDKLLPRTRIQNATLSLLHESGNNSNVPVSAHRIVNPWDEANVTWEKADTQDWDTQGGDLDDSAISTTLVGPTSGIRYEWDLTSLVQGWADNAYPNYGVALRTLQNGSIGERFYTSDETIETRRPRLTITYACACGEVCVTPQGSGNLLMVVINPTTLVAEDQQAKDLFESWGYIVSVVGESGNQATYDAAVAANDVVFISETVNSGSVGSKLVGATIGVVSQDGDYNPDLGLATGSAVKVGADINVTDTDHYITRVFSTGPLQVYMAGMEQLIVSSAPTAGQQVLADIGGDASLVALEKGDAMEGGGNAAGRRVMLPIGTRYRFNWDRLNANGRVMVQRALAWGANADKVAGASPLLMVVANPAALTAQETAKKALIESWDYGVNLIDDAASPTEFVDAFAVNSVIYVSGDVSDAALSSKLVKTSLGVVNEQIALHDELLLSTSAGTNDFNNISVIDNAHYITDGFATGWLTIATVNQPLNALQGTLAPGLKNLAEVWINGANYDYGLAVVDTGGALNAGEIAAGRRAQLPWGATGFDVNTLNNNGETIMQRAIEWAAGGGCGSLQPLLLVVGDATTLSSKDAGMKNLMESWCYLVTVIDDGDSQASFDAAAAAADVVYVSGTTSGPSLQDKLTGSPTPIVNEINGKLDNFGFSSSTSSSVTASAFSATNASHYISEPFAGNPVTFFTTDLAMPVPGGTLAPDLQTVGETTGAIPTLVTLDAGAQRWDGNPAPARRVHLPFTNADPSQLTADGEILMQRAIEWAIGTEASLGPIAHWKLDETSGPTAVDSEGGHDGTWTNGPAAASGTIDGGLDFDGSNDYVDLTSDAELDDLFVGGATVMAWIEPAGWGENGYGRIFDKSSSPSATGDGWVIRMNVDNGGIINFGQGFTGGRGWWKIPNASISLDAWQHIAIAYDASSTANDPIIYLDGSPVLVQEVDTPSGDLRSDAAINLRLGNFAGGTTHTFDGVIDDARIYDRLLSAAEIADIYAANPPPAVNGYTEMNQPWTASTPDNWETVDLGTFGVPPNAVVEVAVINEAISAQRWGGVRAVGSSVDRRIQLHEAEGGGIDMVTMHAQVNASSQIQHYSDNTGQISFILIGYWTGASYTDALEPFTANNQGVWVEEGVGDDGVGPNQVAEILMLNTNIGAERLAGVRASGATQQRRFMLQEAEGGGVDALSMMVTADASSIIEVYSGNTGDIDFYILGTWGVPPGTYTGTGGSHGQVSAPTSWETIDLGSFGVPADSIVQFVLANENGGAANSMRVRELGSTINNRGLNLHEAESGGSDLGGIHANVDSSSQVQWAAQQGPTNGYFYPVGWWVLSP